MKLMGMRIEVSQRDEIRMMQEWLRARGETVPEVAQPGAATSTNDAHAMHMHDGKLMPGMLTPEQMAKLAAARGTGVRQVVSGVHDPAPRRRAGDGEGADVEPGRGTGRQMFRVCGGRRSGSKRGNHRMRVHAWSHEMTVEQTEQGLESSRWRRHWPAPSRWARHKDSRLRRRKHHRHHHPLPRRSRLARQSPRRQLSVSTIRASGSRAG